MRRAAVVAALILASCKGGEPSAFRSHGREGGPVLDLFTNGGFESGNLSSWTVTPNLNRGITYPPASVTDLNLRAGGVANSFARTGTPAESQVPSGLTVAGSTLRFPKYGVYSAVVNESPSGANQNVNTISQSMATTAADVDPADGQIHVRFVVAPVLQNPGHATTQQPYYYILVTNTTQGTTLFSAFNYSNSAGTPWLTDSAATGGAAVYTNWQAVDVPGTAGSIAIGDTVQLQLIAAGCSLGGHWGEVYLDGVGAFLPGLSVVAHAPQKAAPGTALATTYAVNNSGAAPETNTTLVLPMPSQTTFVSISAPPGAVCTLPAVGSSGNVTCNLGSLNPSSTQTITLISSIAAGATGSVLNGSYTVASDQSSALLGPLVSTTVAAGTYADLAVSITDGLGAVAWGQAVQYTIVVSNAGPTTATGATVVDTLPAQLTGATWTCTAAGGGSCGAASGAGNVNTTVTLPSGGSATYLLTANVITGTGTGRVTNVVNVATAGTTTDPDTTNNRAADTDDIGTVVTVTVTKDATGTGQGAVVSAPVAINCGPACASASSNFASGNLVTLTATAASGDSFAGWSGACSGTSTTCNLNPASNVTATAKFIPQNFNVTSSASGTGTVSCTSPVAHRQSSTCAITAGAGWKLSQLTDNGADVTASVSAGSYVISNIAADHAVVATFLKDLGTACAANAECAGSICADGVCCNSACGGQCQACDVSGKLGTCSPVSGAPHGSRTACTSDGSSCGGSCDGTNTASCAFPGAATSCRSASCASGTATAAASCAGTGSCPAPATTACSPYVCGATACKTTCSADADCISGDYCNAGACVAKKANGGACTAANQCSSSNCVDGYCCNSACGGQCQACDVAGSLGACTTVSGAVHPNGGARSACTTDGTSCGGSCDGTNAASCAYPGASTSCRSASCTSGTATAAASCAGSGSCPAAVTTACNPYACGATACKTTCAADTDCVSGDYCSAGACVPKKTNGGACTAANQCGSGNCVDGVCCNTACGGQCQACDVTGSAGACTTITGTPHGARTACNGSGTCGGTCDGSSATVCAYPSASTSCRGASCASGVATAAASCDGAGNCPAPVTTACNPYVCGGSACKSSCTAGADCIAGDYCDPASSTCLPQKALGQTCTSALQCGSGACVDGYCCGSACGGQCEACDVAGSEGTCTPVSGAVHVSGTLRTACASDGSLCGGSCDGTALHRNTCIYPTSACRNASCANGTATLAANCDGAGSCPAVQNQTCSPYACGPTACLGNCASDANCASGDYCSGGVCVPRQPDGTACSGANQCANNNCVDGYCCNQACGGQCQACDVAGTLGVCTAVTGAPHGARSACATDGSACGGACDGVSGLACAYPTAACRGASCSAGTATAAASCDGAGKCPTPQTTVCDPYVCGPTACLGGCAADTDCVSGDFCLAGLCKPKMANGTSCSTANQCGSGNCVDGVCCDSACGGQCQACDVSGSLGTCTTVTSGAPHAPRTACNGAGACAGSCDGTSATACGYPTAQCRGASCSAGTATLAASCDGAGNCPAAQVQSCGLNGCAGAVCAGGCTRDQDCPSNAWCSAGVCQTKLPAGSACGATGQCSSGNCVDGVCCDTACGGQCEACNVAGSVGTCSPVTGDPRGARSACAGAGTACGGVCDGASRAACAYPGALTQCRAASCSAGVSSSAASCDGAGQCPAPAQTSCGAFSCGPNACRTACTQDSECAGSGLCVKGVCHSRNDGSIWIVAGTGGCTQTGTAAWPLLLLVGMFALRRKRTRRAAAPALLVCLALASAARAQTTSFVVDRFQPGAGAYDVLAVSSPITVPDQDWHASAVLGYARDPLRLLAIDHPDQVQLLHGQSMLHLGGSYGLFDRFEVGAVLPIAVQQASTGAPMLGGNLVNPVPSSGLGDVRVIPKARIWSSDWLVLGASIPFTLPIGRPDAYLGAGTPSFTPTALLEVDRWFPLRVLADAGVAVRGGRSLSNLSVTSALTYGLGAEIPLSLKLALQATVAGEVNLAGGGAVERPMELMGALRWNVVPGLQATIGGGPGLTIGYGTPRYRLFFSMAMTPDLFPRVMPAQHLAVLPELPAPVAATYAVRDAYPPVVLAVREVEPVEPELARLEDDRVDLLAPILFENDRDLLLVQSRAVLDAAVTVLKTHAELALVRVEGHTDGKGKLAHNKLLSERRARAAMLYLVKHGIAPGRLEFRGFGSEKPIASNGSNEGRARNRRVEMVIVRRIAAVAKPADLALPADTATPADTALPADPAAPADTATNPG